MAAGVLASSPVIASLSATATGSTTESQQASRVLKSASSTADQYVGLIDKIDPKSPQVASAIAKTATAIAAIPAVANAQVGPISADGKAQLITFAMVKDAPADKTNTALDLARDRLDQLKTELSGSTLKVGGEKLVDDDIQQDVASGLTKAEVIALPITLVVLIIIFGGLITAGVPVIGALAGIASSFVVLYGFSRLFALDGTIMTVLTLLGLGLSIDYGLLLVTRYREELANLDDESGISERARRQLAIGRTWATAGRTVLFSGLTVATAMTGLLAFDDRQLRAIGAAGVAAAALALLVAITLTAALIGIFGHNIRPASLSSRVESSSGKFAQLAQAVQRRPLPVIVGSGLLLAILAIPALSLHSSIVGLDQVKVNTPAVSAAKIIEARFDHGAPAGVLVVARTDAATLQQWANQARSYPQTASVGQAQDVGSGVSSVEIFQRGTADGALSQELVEHLRAHRPSAFTAWVAGDSANLYDTKKLISNGLPIAVPVMIGAMLVLLAIMTRSIVVPIKAIVMNVVSMGAVAGVLVVVFQFGWGAQFIGAPVMSGLVPGVLVLVFVMGFGLSMDYELFLLGRIKEYVDDGVATDKAVRLGLQHTGRTITSAAILMAICFIPFAFASDVVTQQIGVGLSTAVVLDATLVRCLLVPATMTILGRWNWWPGRASRSQPTQPGELVTPRLEPTSV